MLHFFVHRVCFNLLSATVASPLFVDTITPLRLFLVWPLSLGCSFEVWYTSGRTSCLGFLGKFVFKKVSVCRCLLEPTVWSLFLLSGLKLFPPLFVCRCCSTSCLHLLSAPVAGYLLSTTVAPLFDYHCLSATF